MKTVKKTNREPYLYKMIWEANKEAIIWLWGEGKKIWVFYQNKFDKKE